MNSALQLELKDLHGLPYIATIIWFVLLGVSLLAVFFYLFQKNYLSKRKVEKVSSSEKKTRAKGF